MIGYHNTFKVLEKNLALRAAIFAKFHIPWMTVSFRDLDKPLYSGLAASILISSVNKELPRDIDNQAEFWRRYYRIAGLPFYFRNLAPKVEPCL